MKHLALIASTTLALAMGCSLSKGNQQKSPSTSPSGTYTLEVKQRDGQWYPEIQDQSGDRVFRDGVGFPEGAALGWAWDDQDRVWIYDAKSKAVDVIEKRASMGGAYWRHVWTSSHPCAGDDGGCPPLSIYPEDVRAQIEKKGR